MVEGGHPKWSFPGLADEPQCQQAVGPVYVEGQSLPSNQLRLEGVLSWEAPRNHGGARVQEHEASFTFQGPTAQNTARLEEQPG